MKRRHVVMYVYTTLGASMCMCTHACACGQTHVHVCSHVHVHSHVHVCAHGCASVISANPLYTLYLYTRRLALISIMWNYLCLFSCVGDMA